MKRHTIFILLIGFCILFTQKATAQNAMFHASNHNIFTAKKGTFILGVTSTFQSRTQLSGSINYSPIDRLNFNVSMMNNEITKDGSFAIGTSHRFSTKDSLPYSGYWDFDAYTGVGFYAADYFELGVKGRTYFGQLGAHFTYKVFKISFITKMHFSDVSKLEIANREIYRIFLDEIDEKDPYIYPETKTRISITNHGISAFMQVSKLSYKDAIAINDRIRLSLGATVTFPNVLSNFKKPID